LLIILAVIVLAALKMARQWEQAVVLRAAKFLAVRGPGLFWIIPVLDTVAAMIDTHLRTTQFVAEQTLTKDTVPVDVDAIIFRMVTDVRRAALEVASYEEAISWAAQTTLREMIGAADLAAAVEPQGGGRGAAQDNRRQDRGMGDRRQVSRDSRCHNPDRTAGCDEPAGAGRAQAPSARHLWRRRGRDRPQLLPRRRGATPTTQSRSTCVA
jgi:hypothetical protein